MKILIMGAGAYGLALANILSDKNEVTVYSSIKEEIENLKATRKNERLFKDVILPEKIKYTDEIEESEIIVIALPSKIIKQELEKQKEKLKNKIIILASKGITQSKFLHEIVKETLDTENIYVISGPSFAKDVIEKQEITLTLAGKEKEKIKNIFNNEYIKIEETEDIIGTEICGALKNTFAIGAGILEGLDASESTKAAFLTKTVNDIKKIIKIFGGNENTILQACGIGDIILTCTSKSSRNYTLGKMIGSRVDDKEINNYITTTTIEGLTALRSIHNIINDNNIDIPMINLIYDIVYNRKNPDSLTELLAK